MWGISIYIWHKQLFSYKIPKATNQLFANSSYHYSTVDLYWKTYHYHDLYKSYTIINNLNAKFSQNPAPQGPHPPVRSEAPLTLQASSWLTDAWEISSKWTSISLVSVLQMFQPENHGTWRKQTPTQRLLYIYICGRDLWGLFRSSSHKRNQTSFYMHIYYIHK